MPDQLFCSIRKRWIKATPEEKIRQFLIHHMTEKLGYPKHAIILEKKLNQLPHLEQAVLASLPTRRIDLIVLVKDLHPNFPFYPLLLVECKATPLNQTAMRQVLGYNHFLGACFVALANQDEIQLGWKGEIVRGLPAFEILMEEARRMFINHLKPTC